MTSSTAVLPADVPLAPEVRRYLSRLGNADFIFAPPLFLSRFLIRAACWLTSWLEPSYPLLHVWDETHPFGRLRFYRPRGPAPKTILLYIHGGGFVICGIETHDGLCRALAQRGGFLVASLDYRLAPEHLFPAAQRDVLAAYAHLRAAGASLAGGAGPVEVAVGGDSAGGNLAASLSLVLAMGAAGDAEGERVAPLARLAALPQPWFLLLLYPAVDMMAASASHVKYARGWFLSARMREFFWRHFLGPAGPARDALARLPLLSPLLAARALLAVAPPALVVTAEHDILHDEGVAFAAALRVAGQARVEHVEAAGLWHGFANALHVGPAARAVEDAAERLARLDAELRGGVSQPSSR